MIIILTTLLLSTLLLVGYVDDSSFLTSSDSEFKQQSNSPNWVLRLGKESMSVGNPFSIMNNIDIELCKEAI